MMTSRTGTACLGSGLWCRWTVQAHALQLPPALPTTSGGEPSWRRAEHDAGRRLLAALLCDTLGHHNSALVRTATGKPILQSAPRIGVSISHSYPWVAVAAGTDRAVGVDVEAAGPAGQADMWEWTIREACVKATGDGLAGRPERLPITSAETGTCGALTWRALRNFSITPLSVAWAPA